ncbi:MAG: viperin family antiviral radical SAM protein [Chloroflexi bacterium]|nr:viperin family antiviral radical SAM protein [Chloroflexota bacterium]
MKGSAGIPAAANFHINRVCNERCPYCFATFRDDARLDAVHRGLPLPEAVRVVNLLADAGIEKLNFAGGEPTLYPGMPHLLRHARGRGLVTSLVTNGARLTEVLAEAAECIDWVALSIDSADEDVQRRLGRGNGNYVARSLEHFHQLHRLGIRTKMNTVVNRLNIGEDMSNFVEASGVERWKNFQALPVDGQNDGRIEDLLVTQTEFGLYVERHRHLESKGIMLAPEANEDMRGSYAMVDPLGRFFSSLQGRHHYSRPILEVGVVAAFAEIGFDPQAFERRGGVYPWGRPRQDGPVVPLTIRGR